MRDDWIEDHKVRMLLIWMVARKETELSGDAVSVLRDQKRYVDSRYYQAGP
jgi:hypothetical protein